jgi:choline transport protein
MNYVSAVYVVVIAVISIDWLVRGRKTYRSQSARHNEVEGVVTAVKRRASSVALP